MKNKSFFQYILVCFVLAGCIPQNSSLISSLMVSSNLSFSSEISSNNSMDSLINFSSSNVEVDPAFRYLGQSWQSAIRNQGEVPLLESEIYAAAPQSNYPIVGTTDVIGYGTGQHGLSMVESLRHYYPEIGVEGIKYSAFYKNNAYYNPQDLYSGLYVDLLNQPVNSNLYGMALFLAQKEQFSEPSFFVSASTAAAIFHENSLNFDEVAASAWRMVEAKDGTMIPVNWHAYQLARWLETYGEEKNVLYLAALENNYADLDSTGTGPALDCNQGIIQTGESYLCGAESAAIIETGHGLDSTLFVGHLDTRFDQIGGLATGKYLQHTIYSSENSIDHSNSHTVPTVTGFLAYLSQYRRNQLLTELSASQWKRVLLQSSDWVETTAIKSYLNFIAQVEPITVRVLNKEQAMICAIDLACLE